MSQITTNVTASSLGAVLTLTGNSGGAVPPNGAGNINIVGSVGIVVTDNPGTHTLTISGATEGGSFVTDSGTATPAAGVIQFKNAASSQGTARFTAPGSSNLVDLIFTDADNNTAIGLDSFGTPGVSTGNSAYGFNALGGAPSNNNTAVGINSLVGLNGGGSENVALGGCGQLLATGNYNTFVGENSASAYTSSESSNIILGYNNDGTIGESNVLRIGNMTGTSSGNLNSAYICGIYGINAGSIASVVSINSSNQLGETVITAGTGISITPGASTITISATGTTNLTYTSVSSSPYVVASTDDFLGVTTSSVAITVELPNAPATGRVYTIKDISGSASSHNITVTTVGGSVNIDAATTFVMNTNYESIDVLFNGSAYLVF